MGEELGDGVALEAEVVVVLAGVTDEAVGADVPEGVAGLGVTGLGASTPAVPEPKPNFCRLGASILPLLLRPLSD